MSEQLDVEGLRIQRMLRSNLDSAIELLCWYADKKLGDCTNMIEATMSAAATLAVYEQLGDRADVRMLPLNASIRERMKEVSDALRSQATHEALSGLRMSAPNRINEHLLFDSLSDANTAASDGDLPEQRGSERCGYCDLPPSECGCG